MKDETIPVCVWCGQPIDRPRICPVVPTFYCNPGPPGGADSILEQGRKRVQGGAAKSPKVKG